MQIRSNYEHSLSGRHVMQAGSLTNQFMSISD